MFIHVKFMSIHVAFMSIHVVFVLTHVMFMSIKLGMTFVSSSIGSVSCHVVLEDLEDPAIRYTSRRPRLCASSSSQPPHYIGRRFRVIDTPQQVLVASTAQQLKEVKFALEAADIAAVIATNVVDAIVQTSRPPSPDCFVRVKVIGTFLARINTALIFPRDQHPRQAYARTHLLLLANTPPRPSFILVDSNVCQALNRPESLFAHNLPARSQGPRTRTLIDDKSLLNPLHSQSTCVLLLVLFCLH